MAGPSIYESAKNLRLRDTNFLTNFCDHSCFLFSFDNLLFVDPTKWYYLQRVKLKAMFSLRPDCHAAALERHSHTTNLVR